MSDTGETCRRRAVVAGLTAVDPKAYGGWNGDCPGCDLDAERFSALCREAGIKEVTELHNEAATQAILTDCVKRAVAGLGAGDLLVVAISGHGGQVPDESGDESDGLDETLCLWDGQLSDDVIGDMLTRAPAGLRILFVTDTCNSGTNYRYAPRSMAKALPQQFAGEMIHFGGCADGKSSIGTGNGGLWTNALLKAFKEGLSYVEWFKKARRRMPRVQRPVYGEYGAVTETFRKRRALT